MDKLKQMLSDKADIIGGLTLIILPLLTALVESENGLHDSRSEQVSENILRTRM